MATSMLPRLKPSVDGDVLVLEEADGHHWTRWNSDHDSFRLGRAETPLFTVRSEWNCDVLVNTPDGVQLWRASPQRVRRKHDLWFSEGTRLWGITQAALGDDLEVSFRGRNGKPYQFWLDEATGLPLDAAGRPLTEFEPGSHGQPCVGPFRERHAWDVFLSYKHRDGEEFAEAFFEELRRRQVRVFFDKDAMPVGINFENSLGEALRESTVSLIVATDGTWDPPAAVPITRIDGTSFTRPPFSQLHEIESLVRAAIARSDSNNVIPYWCTTEPYDEAWGSVHRCDPIEFNSADHRPTSDGLLRDSRNISDQIVNLLTAPTFSLGPSRSVE